MRSVVPASAAPVSDELCCQAGVLAIEVKLNLSSSPPTELTEDFGEKPIHAHCPHVKMSARDSASYSLAYTPLSSCSWIRYCCGREVMIRSRKVTVGLTSHWQCVTYPLTGSKTNESGVSKWCSKREIVLKIRMMTKAVFSSVCNGCRSPNEYSNRSPC